jgi:hypothetical protein
MQKSERIYPVILAGGKGERLWPLSRAEYPKQIITLIDDTSLIEKTVLRVGDAGSFHFPLVICNDTSRFLIADQLQKYNISDIIIEPAGRNTAAAAAVAALKIAQTDPGAIMLILPSDHNIENVAGFLNVLSEATAIAKQGKMVNFGIIPDSVKTGYGYIKFGEKLPNTQIDAFVINKFVEKPDYKKAEEYTASGKYLWNSGMFLMPVALYIKELQEFAPEILKYCKLALDNSRRDSKFLRLNAEYFNKCPSDSIDYSVMEKTINSVVIPVDIGWRDIGAWDAVWQVEKKDVNNNVLRGDVLTENCSGSYLRSDGSHLLACMDLENMLVVTTRDATLVAPINKAQELRNLTQLLIKHERREVIDHPIVYRPWGNYCSLVIEPNFQVKKIMVKPGGMLSLQKHEYRSEHWVVVKGAARVTRGKEIFILNENESTYIAAGQKHRLENPGQTILEVIEVQSGVYLGEDDITRYDDVYGRAE